MSWNCASIIQKWYMNQWTSTPQIISHMGLVTKVRLFRCWLIAKPGNKTAVPSWPEPHTIKCSFDVVHLITTFSHSTAMAAEKKNTEQASHTSPKRASYGVSHEDIGENGLHYNCTALCLWSSVLHPTIYIFIIFGLEGNHRQQLFATLQNYITTESTD